MLRAVAVFCGSSLGRDDGPRAAARALGDELLRRDLTLVYGGGRVGLMGLLADRVLHGGGRVVGVIPSFLQTREVAHPDLHPPDLVVTDTLFARKEVLIERADAFVALPGGLGTLDELFEVVTLAQLGRHAKPCGLLDVDGYFAPLLAQLRVMAERGFLSPGHAGLLRVHGDPAELLDELERRSLA